MTDFKQKVISFIQKVPNGRVVSYGQVAAAAGSPRAARQVGGVLRALGPDSGVPWWRVINNRGIISIKGNWEAAKELQRDLLEREGVKVNEHFTVDMVKYRFAPLTVKNYGHN